MFERYIHESLPAHLRPVSYAGQYILPRELWVFLLYLFNGQTCRDEIQNKRYPDAMSPDARLTETHLWIY
jgi:hypothetical protein